MKCIFMSSLFSLNESSNFFFFAIVVQLLARLAFGETMGEVCHLYALSKAFLTAAFHHLFFFFLNGGSLIFITAVWHGTITSPTADFCHEKTPG